MLIFLPVPVFYRLFLLIHFYIIEFFRGARVDRLKPPLHESEIHLYDTFLFWRVVERTIILVTEAVGVERLLEPAMVAEGLWLSPTPE